MFTPRVDPIDHFKMSNQNQFVKPHPYVPEGNLFDENEITAQQVAQDLNLSQIRLQSQFDRGQM